MHLSQLDTTQRTTAQLVHSARVTPESSADEVREIVLNIADPQATYLPGQSLGILAQDGEKGGELLRLFLIEKVQEVPGGGGLDLHLFVRRAQRDTEHGVRVSHQLCDAPRGEVFTVCGPYDNPFKVPMDNRSHLLMIGCGSDISPFHALALRAYEMKMDWRGRVRVFYGDDTGLENLYTNRLDADLPRYYDPRTHKAFEALKTRRSAAESRVEQRSLEHNLDECWELLREPHVYVFIAGHSANAERLEALLAQKAGSADSWQALKKQLKERNHWTELLY